MPINKIYIIANKRANTLGVLRSYMSYKNKNEAKILLEKIFKVFIINQVPAIGKKKFKIKDYYKYKI
jgi:hypothetical protein